MAGYGVKEARISRERKPTSNFCGSCFTECDGLLCDDCRGTLGPLPSEDEGEEARRTR